MSWELDTQRILNFDLSHTPDDNDEDFHYIDIAKMLSAVNRKSYRQGMTYDVANMVFHDSADTETFISVCTVPNTWALQASWAEGFFRWMQQQKAAVDTLNDSEFGPWHDFKVYANKDMVADVDKPNFVDTEGNALTAGEWIYSKYLVPRDGSDSPISSNIGLIGPHVGSPFGDDLTYASLMQAFENNVNIPQEDPDITTHTTLWAALSPAASDMEVIRDVLDDYEADNDLPPYSPAVIPGAGVPGAGRPSEPWRQRLACIQGGANHMAAVGGFQAPCGLIIIDSKQADAETIGVQLELVPGDYKGVSARKMRRPAKGKGNSHWMDRLED